VTRRITLIRHGRSSYKHPGGLMSAADMKAWRVGYDGAGILDADAPPAGLSELVTEADILLASDMPRAIQTAQRLKTDHRIQISALLREAPTGIPNWGKWKMPRTLWEGTALARWGIQIARGKEIPPDDLARATHAANWLDDLSTQHAHIAAVTHGTFRRYLARRLEYIGWHPDGRRRSYRHWSVWTLSKP
jgi:broad specificity phosphatase PhoE